VTTLVASESRFVSLAAIERELARPWQHPGGRREEQTTRALMGNLIAVCRSERERAGLEREVAQIVPHYPPAPSSSSSTQRTSRRGSRPR